MIVSTASTWQKNGRMLWKGWCRQCWSRRAVSGVTCQSVGIRELAPSLDVSPDFVDDGGRVVFLLGGGQAVAAAQHHLDLAGFPPPLLAASGTGVIRSERRLTSRIRLVGWPVFVQLPMLGRVFVGRVEDGSFEETFLRHAEVPHKQGRNQQFLQLPAVDGPFRGCSGRIVMHERRAPSTSSRRHACIRAAGVVRWDPRDGTQFRGCHRGPPAPAFWAPRHGRQKLRGVAQDPRDGSQSWGCHRGGVGQCLREVTLAIVLWHCPLQHANQAVGLGNFRQ